ncbi:unnamed protein product [Bursaphelenchus xylophilus]|uniref:Ribulose-phosphate 3-epimerase n=1 Tax=Bursaphelenchus xylophilus TaxID=6326 RepID=A0A1I7RKW7_BURXY|nr:unnamed protein product [Bursaphelenchus xylophilus]CAG9083778.1 unnamed protein product [Bursaphelenchus xylophilus]
MKLRPIIGPSILNADLSILYEECKNLLDSGADQIHLDVMDGHFVPNLTFGHPLVDCLRKKLGPEPFFDMHLMVSNPAEWLVPMKDAGANQYTFHYEALADDQAVSNLIKEIKTLGLKASMAIKPKTDVAKVWPFAKDLDNVLVMTVEPGFGGQKFMSDQLEKVKKIRSQFPELTIQVDGGVSLDNVTSCALAGANSIVSGTGLIRQPDRAKAIAEMKRKVVKGLEGFN